MKLTIDRAALHAALRLVGRAANKGSTLPVLANVLLVAEQGRLRLRATNLDITLMTSVEASVEVEGGVTVSAAMVTDIVGRMPDGPLTLTLDEKSLTLTILARRRRATVRGLAADQFPPAPFVNGTTITLPAGPLREAIAQTIVAAARNDVREVLNGICWQASGSILRLSGADGFRLAMASLPWPGDEFQVIIPAKTMNELLRLIDKAVETVDIVAQPQRVMFRVGDVEMVTQTINGTAPDYQRLIPPAPAVCVETNAAELAEAVRLGYLYKQLVDNETYIYATLAMGTDDAVLSVAGRELEEGQADAQVDATLAGQEFKVTLNSRYLLDTLEVMPTGRVVIGSNGPATPARVTPVGRDDVVHVIMPMHEARRR